VVSASASVLEGRTFSRLGLTKTLKSDTAAFFPGARCAEELQRAHPEYKTKAIQMKADIVPTQSWHYKTTIVVERHQQNTI